MASSRPSEQNVPPLVALLTKLKLRIIAYLSYDTSPKRTCLRRTHTSFLNVIPKSDIGLEFLRFLLCSQLLAVEVDNAYLLPLNHNLCHKCTVVLCPRNFHSVTINPHLVSPACKTRYRRRDNNRHSDFRSDPPGKGRT